MTAIQPDRAELHRQRADELGMRIRVPKLINWFTVVQVGRFYPGGVGVYAQFAVVTAQLDADGKYHLATQMAAFADDRPTPEWYLYSGRYDFNNLGQAQADLETR